MSFEPAEDRGGYGSNAPRAIDTNAGSDLRGPSTGGSGMNEEMNRRLEAALLSPYGIEKLLNRLKQSIFSAKEFSAFLRERYMLEERYAQGYKRVVRHATDILRKPEARQGSYARQFDESLRINERLADNGLQLASALQHMAEELRDIADRSEKGRKHWKHTTINAEKELAEAETARQKAKDRYNNAAEQYDRVRNGDRQAGKFGLNKKNPAQQEEALKDKADSLDQEYSAKAKAAEDQRHEFESSIRMGIARALQDLIAECDAVLALQLAKLASFSEKHLVTSGMLVAPIRGSDTTGPEPRGLRLAAQDVDNDKDFFDYMLDGVDPPPQLKGRSRRGTGTGPDLVETPVRATSNVYDPRQSFDTPPHNEPQRQAVSTAPQLPQIGQDSFSKSFEMQRPNAQNRTSYLGSELDSTQKSPVNQPQQTGVTQNALPSIGAGRGAPVIPSLPSYDRAQPPPSSVAFDAPARQNTSGLGGPYNSPMASSPQGVPGFNRPDQFSGPPPRQDTMGQNTFDRSAGPQRQDTMNQTNFDRSTGAPIVTAGNQINFDRSTGPPRPDNIGPNTFGQNPNPQRQGSMPPNGFEAPSGPPPRQNTLNMDSFDRPTGPPQQKTPGMDDYNRNGPPSRQDTMPPTGRGQSAVPSTAQTYSGRGQPAPGSFLDQSRSQVQNQYAPAPGGFAGRGQQPPAQRGLPSQQPPRQALPPNNPVFGVHLDELFRRDGSAVPAIVFQCVQAIDSFGLNSEGIYRVNGSTPAVMQLKSEFDHDSNLVKLTTPSSFSNDINSVATLLKTFLRDLPDSLLTNAAYGSFINAAKFEDNIMRRDALHQNINSLPDPNYATLRVLTLHLHRLAMNADVNKMDMHNLAIVFGPTVMGGGANVSDAGWQTKVMETILAHTHDVFDPDE